MRLKDCIFFTHGLYITFRGRTYENGVVSKMGVVVVITYRDPLRIHARELLEESCLFGYAQIIIESENVTLTDKLKFCLQVCHSFRRRLSSIRAKGELSESIFDCCCHGMSAG